MSQEPKPKQQRVTLRVPKDLTAVYANAALIANTPAEFVIDFIQMLPRMPQAQVQARVILSPMHAKLLLRALATNVANFERKYGEINIPKQQSIADAFFNFPREDDDEDDE